MSIRALPPLEEGGSIARTGFLYQDHVAARYCIRMLRDPSLAEVWCETEDDVTLLWEGSDGLMVEFVQQNNAGPSPFRDLYPEGSGRWGLHHVALFVDDVDGELDRYAAAGHPVALRAEMNDGFVFAFADTTAMLGHMTELYAPVPALLDFYAMVADAASDWDGDDPIRTIDLS